MILLLANSSINNIIEFAFENSGAYQTVMDDLVQTLFLKPGTPFNITTWIGTLIALIGMAFFFTQWSQQLQKGQGFTKLGLLLILIILLGNKGNLARQVATGALQVGWQVERNVLDTVITPDGTVGDLIHTAKMQNVATQVVAQRRRECLGLQVPLEIAGCQAAETQAALDDFSEIEDPSLIQSYWTQATNLFDLDLIPSLDDLGAGIASGFELVVGSFLWIIVAAWSIIFDVAVILTALLFPIAVGTATFSSSPLVSWISGLSGLYLTKISLLLTWSMISAISLAQATIAPLLLGVLAAVFSPVIAIFVGSKGGLAFQSAISQATTFASASGGYLVGRTLARGGISVTQILAAQMAKAFTGSSKK